MKDAGHVVQRLTIDNDLPRVSITVISDCGTGAECPGIGVDVRAINPFAVGGEREIASAAAGQQALDLLARL